MKVHVGVSLVVGGTLACAPRAHALCASKHGVEGERASVSALCHEYMMCVCQRRREIGHPIREDATTNQSDFVKAMGKLLNMWRKKIKLRLIETFPWLSIKKPGKRSELGASKIERLLKPINFLSFSAHGISVLCCNIQKLGA